MKVLNGMKDDWMGMTDERTNNKGMSLYESGKKDCFDKENRMSYLRLNRKPMAKCLESYLKHQNVEKTEKRKLKIMKFTQSKQ